MDEFAQSREDDDLFADELEAVPEQVITVETSSVPDQPQIGPQPTPRANEYTSSIHPSNGQSHLHANRESDSKPRNGRGRGGGGGGGHGAGGIRESRWALPDDDFGTLGHLTPKESTSSIDPTTSSSSPPPTITNPANPTSATESHPPTEPANHNIQPQRVPAVRGDRSATGGPAHKKLTEEELTAKLAQMAIINAQKAERHRLTLEDQAAFQHREKELAKERKEKQVRERKNERVMEMERERNRLRKLNAQHGREWDMEKVEDVSNGRSSQFVRGDFGGVIRGRGGRGNGLGASRYSTEEDPTPDSAPARGGRGGMLGIRGRGRGGRGNQSQRQAKSQTSNPTPAQEDFPALPTADKTAAPKTLESDLRSPISDKPAGDWAEEMATPVEEKKFDY